MIEIQRIKKNSGSEPGPYLGTPMIVCDFCGEQIRSGGDAVFALTETERTHQIMFVHDDCHIVDGKRLIVGMRLFDFLHLLLRHSGNALRIVQDSE